MLETPVVKTGNYRGQKFYIRKIGRENFEYLIPMDDMLFCNQVEIARKAGQRFSPWTDDDLEKAVGLMIAAAHDFIEDQLFKKEEFNQWKNRWRRLVKKVGDISFHWKYKLSELYDNHYGKKIPKRTEGKSGRGAGD